MTDPLPPGLTFVQDNPSQGAYDSTTGIWTFGTIGVTQSATLLISAMVTQPGTFTNTVTKTQNEFDPNPANDTASVTVTTPSADLAITKTDGLEMILAGNNVTYTITVVNGGPSAVVGAPVTDTFPPELDPTSISWMCVAGPGASCKAPGTGTGNIDTTVSLPSGAAATFTVMARVLPAATGTLTNTAMVAPPPGTTDPDGDNNTATDMTAIVASADLIASKSSPASVTPPDRWCSPSVSPTRAHPRRRTWISRIRAPARPDLRVEHG